MKLRFWNNSLRLRLNRRETDAIAAGSALSQQLTFPEGTTFSYSLEATTRLEPEASFQHGVIRIGAPETELKKWAAGNEIGIYFALRADGSELKVAIEKDLECVEAPAEERDPDAFPRSDGKSC